MYFIKLQNGNPIGHPIAWENFVQAFPAIDPRNPIPLFAHFERVEKPEVKGFVLGYQHGYGWDGAVVKDVWTPIPMNDEQKQVYLQNMEALRPGASWTLDEKAERWIPPVPKPTDGEYMWVEEVQTWIKVD